MATPRVPEIDTVLVVRELPGGDCSVFPLADPSLVSFGELEACLEEQRLFLAEHLGQARPEVVARFSHGPDVSRHETTVVVPRPDLPQRLQVRTPVPVPAAVIPSGRSRWVVLLPLAHTFHLDARDDLDEAIRRETLRVCLARQLDGAEYRDLLLAPGTVRLERLRLAVATEDRTPTASGPVSPRQRLAESRQRQHALSVLASVARPLHARVVHEPAAALAGRAREQAQLSALLGGRERASVLLVGRDKVGKSALLHDWIRAERRSHRTRLVFATSAARLVAGMSGLGQWQERVRRVMAAAETLDAIVCFESLAELFGDRPDGLVDLPGALKPWMDERRVRIVGEMTPEALAASEARWAAFLGGFHRITAPPLSREDTAEPLRGRAARAPDLTLAADTISAMLELGDRYLPYEAWPISKGGPSTPCWMRPSRSARTTSWRCSCLGELIPPMSRATTSSTPTARASSTGSGRPGSTTPRIQASSCRSPAPSTSRSTAGCARAGRTPACRTHWTWPSSRLSSKITSFRCTCCSGPAPTPP